MEKSSAPVGWMIMWSHGNKVMWCITDHIRVGLTAANTNELKHTHHSGWGAVLHDADSIWQPYAEEFHRTGYSRCCTLLKEKHQGTTDTCTYNTHTPIAKSSGLLLEKLKPSMTNYYWTHINTLATPSFIHTHPHTHTPIWIWSTY